MRFKILIILGLFTSFLFPSEPYEYRIGPKDLLVIKVFQVPELNTTVRVGEDGTITLPLVGKIRVEGLTRYQLEERIASLLSEKYVKNPQVTVFIKEYRSRTAMIMGAVKKPGAYEVVGKTTLIQLIAQAGGITSRAQDRIIILREREGKQKTIVVPIVPLLFEGRGDFNVEIFPGDVVNIPGEMVMEVYVFGQVRKPGVVELPMGYGATILQAIAKAGGFTERAKKSSVILRRREGDKGETIIKVNVKDILKGKKPNVKLRPYDIIYVPESLL